MTGTQSLSIDQLNTIHREAQRDYPAVNKLGHELRGNVVSVVIHQSMLKGDGRKRVQLHRAWANSISFGVLRDGSIIPSGQAA